MDAKKAAMSTGSACEIVELNIGGQFFTTRRSTLLAAPESSFLNSMFSGRWDGSIDKDAQGRVFLDFTPSLFSIILSQLRTIVLGPSGAGLEYPKVADEQKQEFAAMISYMNLGEIFGTTRTAQSDAPVKMNAVKMKTSSRGGNGTVENDDGGATLTCRTGNRAVFVGKDPMIDTSAIWKTTVIEDNREEYIQHSNGFLDIGVIDEEAPQPPCNGAHAWGNCYTNSFGKRTCSSWSGWRKGDVAIFRMDPDRGVLKMYHERHGRTFTIDGITPGPYYRQCVLLGGHGSCVHIENATQQEALLIT